jgi:L-iditol 2-dehydrogenase
MLTAVYYNNHDVRIEEIPKPEIGNGEFLLKVMASGICGSDVTEWYRVPKAPKVLGHEATGVIAETGAEVAEYRVGDRVFVSHHVPCNKCRYCLSGHHTACETLHTSNYFPGGFSEYIRVPRINVERGVYRLPLDMSYEEGTFIEPLACVVRGQRLAAVKKEDTVLVIGGGVAGLLHAQLARFRGVRRVVVADLNLYRLGLAERFGADATINAKEDLPQKLMEVIEGRHGRNASSLDGVRVRGQGRNHSLLRCAKPDCAGSAADNAVLEERGDVEDQLRRSAERLGRVAQHSVREEA